MGGMGGGFGVNDPTVVSAFHSALLRGGLVVALLAAAVFVVWRLCRVMQLRRAGADPSTVAAIGPVPIEPAGRRVLRIAFGLLWVFDGVLQGQASMPLGLIPQVVQPAAASSPGWVRHLVDSGASVWSYHPVTAAASAVWIQVGIGLFLLVSGSGAWSRLAGVAGAAWGLIVWSFAEAFGGIFAPGVTWLFGAPGAALLYAVGGVLVALPLSTWRSPALGRWLLRALGVFFVGMAVLQAWPGRGFWQGQAPGAGSAGSLTQMVQNMAQTPQPHLLGSIVSAFARFDAAHGWAVNLFAVIALALTGGALASGRHTWIRAGLVASVVLGLADWVLVEDLGFMGGVGTDPNSMIPILVLLAGGYMALIRVPAPAEAPAGSSIQPSWIQRVTAEPVYALRASAALAAVGVTLVGAAPMAVVTTQSAADPILANAISGPPQITDTPAAPFTLTDQNGRLVSLGSLHGEAVMLAFLDPVCTTDCPVIAAEMKDADRLLGTSTGRVRMVAVNANRTFTGTAFLQAFDHEGGLDALGNWSFLTGSLPQLQAVWNNYGVDVEAGSGGSMDVHSDVAYFIDPQGRVREIINSDPGPSTSATTSSFGQAFADSLQRVLRQ